MFKIGLVFCQSNLQCKVNVYSPMKKWKLKTIHDTLNISMTALNKSLVLLCIVHRRYNAILCTVKVLDYSILSLGSIGDYSTYSTRHLSIDIVGHRLYSRFVDITKEGNGFAGLGEGFLLPTYSAVFFSFLKLLVGCWMLVVGSWFWLSVVSVALVVVVGCRVLVVKFWLSIVGCRCRWI